MAGARDAALDRCARPWGRENGLNPSDFIRCDGVVLSVGNHDPLAFDHLIVAHGWSGRSLQQWVADSKASSPLIRRALQQGKALSDPQQNAQRPPALGSSHAALIVARETVGDPSQWRLLITRKSGAFSEEEVDRAALLLQEWRCDFLRPCERGLGRLLVGGDGRLLASDLNTRLSVTDEELVPFLKAAREVLEQRFGDLAFDQPYDAILTLRASPIWLRWRRRRAAATSGAAATGYDYVEIRRVNEDPLPAPGMLPDDRIAKALGRLDSGFAEAPSLEDVAQYAHLSMFHFHRTFSAMVGMSPKQYLLRRQMQVAKWLLRASPLPVSEVAQQAGFSTHGHFTTTFQRLVGTTPTAYRESQWR